MRGGTCGVIAFAFAFACAVVMSTTAAYAQAPDPLLRSEDAATAASRAEELFRVARDAAKRGDYLTACPAFEQSQSLYPAPGTLLNLADCEERQNRLAHALADFAEVQRLVPSEDPRAQVAAIRQRALEPRVPTLVVLLPVWAPSSTQVRVDDRALEEPSRPLRLEPGDHQIVARDAEGAEQSVDISLAEGESRQVLLAWPQAAPPAAVQPVPGRSQRRALGLVIGGAGLSVLAAGAVTGVLVGVEAGIYKHECVDNACTASGMDAAQTGKVLRIVSPVALGVGAAATAFGAYLFFWASPSVGVRVGASSASVDCSLTF
jgi:tetratricopeptide (TPR) repeat protein